MLLVSLSEVCQTVLVMNIQASPISRMYQTRACGIYKFLRFESVSCMRLLEYTEVFQADAGGGHTSLLFRHVSSRACLSTRAFPSRECFEHALVANIQAPEMF